MATSSSITKQPWLPADFVVAILDNQEAADKATQALKDAGFHPQDVEIIEGDEAGKRLQVDCEDCNVFETIARNVWRALSIEAYELGQIAHQAHGGKVVAVHTDQQTSGRAQEVLRELGARRIERFNHDGTLITDPPERSPGGMA